MNWSTKEFKNLVQSRYGKDQLEKLKKLLSSISWKLMLADYHAEESKRLYRSYLSEEAGDEAWQALGQTLLAASSSEEADKFIEARVLSEAHIIACAQSLHSTADILAHVVYFGLNLENNLSNSTPMRKLGLDQVYKSMCRENFAPHVVDAIRYLKESPEFSYLSAYVNVTKHRSLVDVTHSISFSSSISRYGVKILHFEYKGDPYAEKWADDFVFEDRKAIREGIFRIGNQMNKFLEGERS